MFGEELHGAGGDGHRGSFHVPTVPLQEKVDQGRNILFALAQGQHGDGNHVESEEEIFAKAPRVNGSFQGLVRGGDEADVHGDGDRSPHALELVGLEHPQEFGLELRLRIADLVQEYRASLRQLQKALFLLVRSGKRSLLMAEQLCLQEAFG